MLIGEYFATIDNDGRILLPEKFLKVIGKTPCSDVIVVGSYNHIEIFSFKEWEKQTDTETVKEMIERLKKDEDIPKRTKTKETKELIRIYKAREMKKKRYKCLECSWEGFGEETHISYSTKKINKMDCPKCCAHLDWFYRQNGLLQSELNLLDEQHMSEYFQYKAHDYRCDKCEWEGCGEETISVSNMKWEKTILCPSCYVCLDRLNKKAHLFQTEDELFYAEHDDLPF